MSYRLESSIFAGRESLIVHGTALTTISDNIANSNTAGYKDSRLEFADLFAASSGSLYGGPTQTGNGVQSSQVTINHGAQGSIEATGRDLDAAVDGSGYFVVKDGDTISYTRAGNFVTDVDGNLATTTGQIVMGYTAASPETPVAINLRDVAATAEASTALTIGGNLDPTSPLVANLPAATDFPTLAATASLITSVTSIDSLGAERDIAFYFYRTGPLTWTVQAYADGEDVAGGVKGTPVSLGAGQITVGTNGQPIAGAAPFNVTPAWADGAQAGAISVGLAGFTGLAGGSSVSNVSADGKKGGVVQGVAFNSDGQIIASLQSGEQEIVGTLALADFNSPNGLQRIGNNDFKETQESGAAVVNKANTEGLGRITGSSLESSTVDTATEFIKLIQYQQGYRASSQIIQAVSELMSSTIQIA